MDNADLISVYEAANTIEANLVKNMLEEAGIEASVSDQNEPFAGLRIVPPNVYVKRSDEARARPIVDEYDRETVEHSEAPDWTCPKCGEKVPATFDDCFKCGAQRPAT